MSFLLVANKGDKSLSVIDPTTGMLVTTIHHNKNTGHEVAASSDGQFAYVPIFGNSPVGMPDIEGSEVIVINLNARQVTSTINFGRGVRPHCPVFDPIHNLLYVTTELDKSVSVIDVSSLHIIGAVPTGAQSHMLVVSSDGTHGYTANVDSGTVSVLDLACRKLLHVIPISRHVQRISISRDNSLVFTSDQTVPQLVVIDTRANTVKDRLALPAVGYGAATTPDGQWLAIAMPDASTVGVIDLQDFTVAHVVHVPPAPQEVLARPDGKVVYVSCDASRKIAEIRVVDWKVQRFIDVGNDADGLTWAA
jgi:DNA-binding beta-propeller fold protein YncE